MDRVTAKVTFATSNKACSKHELLLSNINMLINVTASYSMFSLVDGFRCYNQIKRDHLDDKKITFQTRMENLYYTVMPFDLKIAGAYQCPMIVIFHDMLHNCMKECWWYLSEGQIVCKHSDNLRKVFISCRQHKPGMNLLKCVFSVSSEKFLLSEMDSQNQGHSRYRASHNIISSW